MAHPFLNKLFPIFGEMKKVDEDSGDFNDPDPPKEKVLWRSNPSWIINFPYYVILTAIAAALIYCAHQEYFVQPVSIASQIIAVTTDITTQLIAMIKKDFVTSDWRQSPVQVNGYLSTFLLPLILVFLFYLGFVRFLRTKMTRYEITETRISLVQGIINRDEIEAYLGEVTDFRHTRKGIQRLFRKSQLFIRANDDDFGERYFNWISKGPVAKRLLEKNVRGESIRMPTGQLASRDETRYHHEQPDSSI